jgi:hypothetical protein
MKTIAAWQSNTSSVRYKENILFQFKTKTANKIFESILSPILLYNSEVWGAFTCINEDFHKWNQTPI